MAYPTKKNQKFKHLGETYTVASFFGSSGINYDTFKEAWDNNPSDHKRGWINIKNKEYKDGAHRHTECILI